MDDYRLRHIFFDSTYGKKIWSCIQCGTCSGSCPLTDQMDHAPRELFALIRDGEIAEALRSNTPWYCVSCYQCTVRCPQEIPVTDLMYFLKQMTTNEGLTLGSHKLPHLYDDIAKEITMNGRIAEAILIARYGARHPFDILAKLPLGAKLLTRRRLDFLPHRIKNRRNVAMHPKRKEWKQKN